MSKGIGGACRKVLEDAETIIYEYSAYNLNEPKLKDGGNVFDGTIIIQKSGLVEPEIHEKLKKSPSGGKRLETKNISVNVDFVNLFSEKMIVLENCSNCWQKTIEGYDIIGLKLCFMIFNEYQKIGHLPKSLGYNV
ncbi:hypothetical protein [Clostridium botulinum]|uniref:hypothetical protein n=1 Tax=Clostridium botulinum TaxID=1491 RepID=UPI000773174D|nr:hypothetical protein [Clostridium botulinum]